MLLLVDIDQFHMVNVINSYTSIFFHRGINVLSLNSPRNLKNYYLVKEFSNMVQLRIINFDVFSSNNYSYYFKLSKVINHETYNWKNFINLYIVARLHCNHAFIRDSKIVESLLRI